MSDYTLHIIAFLFGIFFFIAFFLMMRFMVFLKIGFIKIFKTTDVLINKAVDLLDSSNKKE